MKPDLPPELQAALESEESGALVALVRAGRTEHVATLRALVRDPAVDAEYRRKALWALGLWGDPSAVPDIEAALPGLETQERIAAIDALGKIGPDRALGTISLYAADPSPQVRKFVVQALARIKDPEAQAMLLEMAARDSEAWIRELATRYVADR